MARISRADKKAKKKDARHDWFHIACFAEDMPEQLKFRCASFSVKLRFSEYRIPFSSIFNNMLHGVKYRLPQWFASSCDGCLTEGCVVHARYPGRSSLPSPTTRP
jgi:hypothetical protein